MFAQPIKADPSLRPAIRAPVVDEVYPGASPWVMNEGICARSERAKGWREDNRAWVSRKIVPSITGNLDMREIV